MSTKLPLFYNNFLTATTSKSFVREYEDKRITESSINELLNHYPLLDIIPKTQQFLQRILVITNYLFIAKVFRLKEIYVFDMHSE